MFFDTHATGVASKHAEARLGGQGRYHSVSNPSFVGISLYTHEIGKFWYGDIDLPAEQEKLEAIAKDLKETLFILPDLGIGDERPLHEQALLEIAA